MSYFCSTLYCTKLCLGQSTPVRSVSKCAVKRLLLPLQITSTATKFKICTGLHGYFLRIPQGLDNRHRAGNNSSLRRCRPLRFPHSTSTSSSISPRKVGRAAVGNGPHIDGRKGGGGKNSAPKLPPPGRWEGNLKLFARSKEVPSPDHHRPRLDPSQDNLVPCSSSSSSSFPICVPSIALSLSSSSSSFSSRFALRAIWTTGAAAV